MIAFGKLHCDLAVRLNVGEISQFIAPHIAVRCREHNGKRLPAFLVLWQRHDRGDRFIFLERQQIDHGLAARLWRALR